MKFPDGDELRAAGRDLFGYAALAVVKVLVIVDGPDGIVAGCTEEDTGEIRGLMYRAGTALPKEFP